MEINMDTSQIERPYCFPQSSQLRKGIHGFLLGAFIQLGLHMINTVPEGIRVKIRGGVTIYYIQYHQVV